MSINSKPTRLQAIPTARHGVAVDLAAVGKAYDARRVLTGIDLSIQPGEFVAIVGRSGCGKSTLLRLLAGLEHPTEGQVRFDGTAPQANRDDLRIMFQDARLLPWRTVIENVMLGLPGKRSAVLAKAREALEKVGLAQRADEWPTRLSGGQRQRVALARALVHEPRLLLLDEPLGALDALTRIEMQELIETLWQRQGFTAILVTHDVAEAVVLADRVLLIEDGAVTLDQPIRLPRSRARGSAAFATQEDRILRRVLQHPANDVSEPDHGGAGEFPLWRWAP